MFLYLLLGSACASITPPNRLAEYVGTEAMREPVPISVFREARPRAGLVLVADTTAPDAAPALPDEALHRLAETLRGDLERAVPITILKVIPPEDLQPSGDSARFSDLGKQHGVDLVALVIASSTEQEYPLTVFLGWHSHSQPGLRRDNWSLLEIALIEVKSGQVLLRVEGRGWATLDRPMAPGINQWYPVIWLRPSDPNWRWWPPTYAGAPNTLRVIAMNEAARRLVPNVQDAWFQARQMLHE
ncbi:MAG: hypothetical protein ACREI2_11335 [Nitrospiraceae bacterium]